MEKTFAHATLCSATVMAVFMIMVPINHLSAQSEVKLDEKVKVRKATIESVSKDTGSLSVTLDEGVTIPVVVDASTTVYFGNGDEADLDALKKGANIYVFGSYQSATKDIAATKIVLRNKRITERTSLSRAQQEEATASTSGPLEMLGLTAR